MHLPTGFIGFVESEYPLMLGGTRMLPDVSEQEVELLAIAMHLKLATFGFPITGAKCGVIGQPNSLADLQVFLGDIQNLLSGTESKFVRDLLGNERKNVHLADSVQLVTGPDIGVSEDLYHNGLRNIGLNHLIRPGLLAQIHSEFNIPLDNVATGFGIIVAAEEVFRISAFHVKSEDPLAGKSYAIEGFGKVASGVTAILKDRCSLLAFSTIDGSFHWRDYPELSTANGFDVSILLDSYLRTGDSFPHALGMQAKQHSLLFESEVDFLIPGARTSVITEEIAQLILQAKIKTIIPASNFPYTATGLRLLENAGVVCFPDFIANAGAVLGAMVEFSSKYSNNEQEKALLNLIAAAIAYESRDLLIEARACGCNLQIVTSSDSNAPSLYQLAIDRAVAQSYRTKEAFVANTTLQDIADDIIRRYLSQ